MHEQPEAEAAEILREYGPYPGVTDVHGVSFDGKHIWVATGDNLCAVAPATGALERSISVPARAGTAFDGRYLYQLADGTIQKIEPASGEVVSRIPAPEPADGLSGMAWAEGFLWIGEYRTRKIHKVDPATGKIVKSVQSDRFVTGVTWVQGELWHGTMGDGPTELREIDPSSGAVRRRLELGAGISASGLESDGNDVLFCGGASSGKVRAIRRPSRKA
jgi:outer membrane protein assembly factor BamB